MAFIQRIERKKGTVYKVHYNDPLTSQRASKNFDRWKEADDFKKSPKVTGKAKRAKLTVGGAMDHWLDVCKQKGRNGRLPVRKSTYKEYEKHARYLKDIAIEINGSEVNVADILLEKLTDDHCGALRDALLKKKSVRFAGKIFTSFKSALKQARTDKYMHHDPAEDIFIRDTEIKPTAEIDDDEEVFELDEVRTLLKALPKRTRISNRRLRRQRRRYNLMVEMLVFSGVRPGEMLGFAWPNVNFDRGGVHVRQDIDFDGTIDELKSKSSYRFIEMPAHYMRKLQRWKKLCPLSKDNLVFPTDQGKPHFLNNFNARGWQPILIDAGLVDEDGKHKYPPKGLRHARASLEIREEDAKPKDVQKMMGHSSIKITFDVYGHLFTADKARRQNRANAVAGHLLN